MALKWKKWLRELVIFSLFAVFLIGAIGYYQQRDIPAHDLPPLSGSSLDGKPLDLQKLATNGPVLVYFWATWCGYCRVVSPAITDLAAEHQVITVALQSGSDEEVQRYLQRHRLDFPTLNDPAGSYSAPWGVRVTPTIVIVNSAGEASWVTSGTTSKLGLQLRLALTD